MKRNNRIRRALAGILLMACVFLTGCGQQNSPLDADHPVTITIWHYYTKDQEAAFNAQVEQFNQTRGKELGIIVHASSEGNVGNLEKSVIAAARQEVGAKKIPNIFAAYSDTAYMIDQMGLVADISGYFTEAELADYIEGYIREGDLDGSGSLKIFPIAKATEIFVLNVTDWNRFADATGADLSDLATIEGVTAAAEAYYNWCGKALFGRDAMANYLLIGAMQLGTEIISVDTDGNAVLDFPADTMRRLWDNYYVPYIKGHFSSAGKYRSDDVKIGNIIGFVGSSTSASFFPDQVLMDNEEAYEIEHIVLEAPRFAQGERYATQQGAGMVVTQGTEAEIAASVAFLKWFTDTEQNIRFSDASDYLPVKKEANDLTVIQSVLGEAFTSNSSLEISLQTVNSNTLYTPLATENGSAVRAILENAMSDQAKADRAAILSLIEEGMSEAEAVALYHTDESFETWYETTRAALEEYFDRTK